MRLFEGTEFDIPPKCERCNELESDCNCPPLPEPESARIPPGKQSAKVYTEVRKGKRAVTIVKGLDVRDLKEVLVKLKNAFGTGGTFKDEKIELQGDHMADAKQMLKELGFRIR